MDFGKERIYNDEFENANDVILWDVLDIEYGKAIKITFLNKNSNYRQGIRIAVDYGDGNLEINGVSNTVMEIWEDSAPKEFLCKCFSKKGKISVYNIWDDRGYSESQSASSGMILEKKDNIFIYHCNDFGFDTKFDKLVFAVEIL